MEPAAAGLAVVGLVVGWAAAAVWSRSARRPSAAPDPRHEAAARAAAADLLAAARREADKVARDADQRARDEALRAREAAARELDAVRAEARDLDRRAQARDDAAARKDADLARKERQLAKAAKKLAARRDELARRAADLDARAEQADRAAHEAAGLTRDQAVRLVLDRAEQQAAAAAAALAQKRLDAALADAAARAKAVVAVAVQRYAAEYTASATVSTVDIPSDDLKGRVIGREGRNIRAFEKATGVDVIVDDTPGVVVVSAFDNVRRETARLALTKLIADGRIHPARIEEVVAETQAEMDAHILSAGKAAALAVDTPPPDDHLLRLLGRLQFRTSYSQNVLRHSVEVAHLCGLMAAEIGLDPGLARRCGLLHDIGKAADHEMEGGHPKVGAELAKRYGEASPEVLHAIAGHHDDVTVDHVYTVLVAAADAISAGRPGARRETLEKYVRRMEDLEAVACGFPEVEAAYAVQAGRELRVIASAQRATDADAARVCREIARAIEERLDYPGEVKVTVTREWRAVEVAR